MQYTGFPWQARPQTGLPGLEFPNRNKKKNKKQVFESIIRKILNDLRFIWFQDGNRLIFSTLKFLKK
jgi:hypothetical protein